MKRKSSFVALLAALVLGLGLAGLPGSGLASGNDTAQYGDPDTPGHGIVAGDPDTPGHGIAAGDPDTPGHGIVAGDPDTPGHGIAALVRNLVRSLAAWIVR